MPELLSWLSVDEPGHRPLLKVISPGQTARLVAGSNGHGTPRNVYFRSWK
jgi:hypothetical protein